MQLSKVRVGRFYTLALRGGGTEKVLAYGILREEGQPPLVTVKDEKGALEHVRARRLSPIERTAEKDMNALIAYADGGLTLSPQTIRAAATPETRTPVVVSYTHEGLPLTAAALDKIEAESVAARTARVYAEAMARS